MAVRPMALNHIILMLLDEAKGQKRTIEELTQECRNYLHEVGAQSDFGESLQFCIEEELRTLLSVFMIEQHEDGDGYRISSFGKLLAFGFSREANKV